MPKIIDTIEVKLKLDLNDLVTHRVAWRNAIVKCANDAHWKGDEVNASYWKHELDVFDRTFAIFTEGK